MGKLYRFTEMLFWMQTVTDNSARITLKRASITLKLSELEHLLLNLTTMANQLARYRRISLRAEYRGSDYLHSSYRIGVSMCSI